MSASSLSWVETKSELTTANLVDKRIDKLRIIVFYDYEKIFVKKELYERNSTRFFPFFSVFQSF